ncbi:MAG: 2'-5' RNA ligase family protein [Mongoliitalea sp.]
MAKSIAKYFIALVPEGTIQEEATQIKEVLKESFKIKYALKSPAHITIKMPFNWNELKEDKLALLLGDFFKNKQSFDLRLKGFDRFGKRVIFIAVKPSEKLEKLQQELGSFSKLILKLPLELSDTSFHPHMTIAFKDLKIPKFDDYWSFIKKQSFNHPFLVKEAALLKRIEGRWVVINKFPLHANSTE